ncbi:MAG: hypothetical protein CVU56_16395 [Deltaproteobacteria bacterium HGW-Deltaproteobacteria-14]|jgi:hypothetical protein|nr:MAG: hypothetical protein CVU56_16395 [Deltaproteobacteria bacterium HGW-Deltaproteobacteria-14]
MDARHIAGAALGLALTAACVGLVGGASREPQRHLLADDAGAIQEIVIHYVPSAADLSAPVYRELLAALPDDVVAWVVVPDMAAFDDLARRLGDVRPTLVPVPVGHAMTTWSRDRWLALAPDDPSDPVTLLLPSAEDGAEAWPARAGDAQTGRDLAAHPFTRAVSERSALYFDGGDFVADAETAFVTPRVLRRNMSRVVADRAHLQHALEVTLGRRVVVLADAPEHHAGMFMMPIGGRRMLVGDPSLAAALVSDPEALIPAGGGADLSAATQARFDAVADAVTAAGYTVTRIPLVPGRDGRTWWTWLNGLLETRAGEPIVYMPTFDAPPALRAAAEAVWRDAGFTVRGVDATTAYTHFGSLRCLVNVLRRG